MTDQIWRLHVGSGPLIATAIHDGHDVRDDVASHLALSDSERLREEDPFTGQWTQVAPTRVVGMRSRFEVDLNRPREKAVYRTPEDAWGLTVWKDDPPNDMFRDVAGGVRRVLRRHAKAVDRDRAAARALHRV